MKIAQIAPLAEAVPPRLYGGTERMVSYLTEELVRQGHEVTLFATGDSRTRAKLVPCCPQALRLDPSVQDPIPHTLMMLDEVRKRAAEFDILHFHLDLMHFPVFRDMASHTLTTLHDRLDGPDLRPFYGAFAEFPLVSISDDQRYPMPPVNWAGTVYHGLPLELLQPTASPSGDYLAFLGRISPEKRPDRAIEIARRANVRIRIAAKVDEADRHYFESEIRPLLEDPLVDFIGEITEARKSDFLGNASALLFPIDWPEPFGLVMIEAMACGTPVIAFSHGSVPEVIDDTVTGFIVEDVHGAVRAVPQLQRLDRQKIRDVFEQRFSISRMADEYVKIYERLACSSTLHSRSRGSPSADCTTSPDINGLALCAARASGTLVRYDRVLAPNPGNYMLAIGSRAPEFTLPDQDDRAVSLSTLLNRGPLILYFYPADFTPGCTREACMLRDMHADILKVGLAVAGVSPQSPERHMQFREKYQLPFTLLSDVEKFVIKMYEVNGPLGLGVRRATYLIDQARQIRGAVLADFRISQHEDFIRKATLLSGNARPIA